MIYLIGDTHFGHTNIIKYCNRPFINSYEMDEQIIKNWNNTVTKDDTIYHLGDFCFKYDKLKTTELIARLNGHKILIKGNHDKKNSCTKWKEMGFEETYGEPIVWNDELLFSHWPTINRDLFNVHAHKHNYPINPLVQMFSTCVSLELTDYKPISIEKVLEYKRRVWR